MQLREIMTTDLRCASPSDSVAHVAAEMKRLNVGAMPVCMGDKLVAMVTDRDIVIDCVAAGVSPKDCQVSSFATSDMITGSPNMDLTEAAQLMGREQIHRLPIVESGRLVGIVSLGDIAVYCKDDNIVAQLIRDISLPTRSMKPQPVAA